MQVFIKKRLRGRQVLLYVAMLGLGAALGYGVAFAQMSLRERAFVSSFHPLRADDSLPLVHPLLAYETPQATTLPEYAALKREFEDVVNEKLRDGTTESISVYYRNVESSRWIGVNEDTVYYPASLLKVPLMIAYFKAEESDPSLFSRRIVYKSISGGADFEAPSELISGSSY